MKTVRARELFPAKGNKDVEVYSIVIDHLVFVFRIQSRDQPALTNTAEKRLRMHQIMKIWRGI
jgi:hypothetical protein